jgi:hypothetical protein
MTFEIVGGTHLEHDAHVVRTPVGEIVVLATQQRRYGATAVHLKARRSRQQYVQLHEGRVALGTSRLEPLDPRPGLPLGACGVTELLHVTPAE